MENGEEGRPSEEADAEARSQMLQVPSMYYGTRSTHAHCQVGKERRGWPVQAAQVLLRSCPMTFAFARPKALLFSVRLILDGRISQMVGLKPSRLHGLPTYTQPVLRFGPGHTAGRSNLEGCGREGGQSCSAGSRLPRCGSGRVLNILGGDLDLMDVLLGQPSLCRKTCSVHAVILG